MPSYSIKKSLISIAKLMVACAVILALYRYGYLDFSALLTAKEHPWFLLLAAFLCALIVLVNGYRWFVVICTQDVRLSVYKVIRGYIYASLSGIFLPGMLGVDAIRSYQSLSWAPQNRAGVLSALLMDRFIGVYSVILITTFFCLLFWDKMSESVILLFIQYVALSSLLGLTIFLILGIKIGAILVDKMSRFHIFHRVSLLKFIIKLLETLPLYKLHWRSLLLCLCLSLVGSVIFLCVLYILAIAQGFNISAGHTMLAGTIATFANAIPITPGGLGIGEGIFSEVCRFLSGAVDSVPSGNILLSWRIIAITSTLAFCPIIIFKRA